MGSTMGYDTGAVMGTALPMEVTPSYGGEIINGGAIQGGMIDGGVIQQGGAIQQGGIIEGGVIDNVIDSGSTIIEGATEGAVEAAPAGSEATQQDPPEADL
jgi:hypothetical protein